MSLRFVLGRAWDQSVALVTSQMKDAVRRERNMLRFFLRAIKSEAKNRSSPVKRRCDSIRCIHVDPGFGRIFTA